MKRTMLSRLILAALAGVAMTASATTAVQAVAVDGITKTATRPEPAMQAAVYDVITVPQTFTAKPWVVGIG